jgi:hypothetical protein
MRLSNFLLWQIAYAELYVTETLVAGLQPHPSAHGGSGIPEARPPLWRFERDAAQRRCGPPIPKK